MMRRNEEKGMTTKKENGGNDMRTNKEEKRNGKIVATVGVALAVFLMAVILVSCHTSSHRRTLLGEKNWRISSLELGEKDKEDGNTPDSEDQKDKKNDGKENSSETDETQPVMPIQQNKSNETQPASNQQNKPDETQPGEGDEPIDEGRQRPSFEVPDNLVATYGDKLSSVSLPKGFTFEKPNNTLVGDAGVNEFKVTYTPDDIKNYYPVKGIIVKIHVRKAMPQYEVPTLVATYGDKLSNVKLTKGFTWEKYPDNMLVGDAGKNSFYAKFTPEDTKNYVIVPNIKVTINVEKATPQFTLPTGLKATYGDNLSVVKLPEGFTFNDNPNETLVGNAGVRQFNVTFTPKDTKNYKTVTGQKVSITVNKAVYVVNARFEKAEYVFKYNAREYSVSLTGDIPEGTWVEYPNDNNVQKEIGRYDVIAIIHGDELNYEPIPQITTKMIIVDKDENPGDNDDDTNPGGDTEIDDKEPGDNTDNTNPGGDTEIGDDKEPGDNTDNTNPGGDTEIGDDKEPGDNTDDTNPGNDTEMDNEPGDDTDNTNPGDDTEMDKEPGDDTDNTNPGDDTEMDSEPGDVDDDTNPSTDGEIINIFTNNIATSLLTFIHILR